MNITLKRKGAEQLVTSIFIVFRAFGNNNILYHILLEYCTGSIFLTLFGSSLTYIMATHTAYAKGKVLLPYGKYKSTMESKHIP